MMQLQDLACPQCGKVDTLRVFRVHAHPIKSMCLHYNDVDEDGKSELLVELENSPCDVIVSESDYMYPGGHIHDRPEQGTQCHLRTTAHTPTDVRVIPQSYIPYAAVFCESCSLFGEWDLRNVFEYNVEKAFKTVKKTGEEK